MVIATVVLSILLALGFLFAGGSKLAGVDMHMKAADKFGIHRIAYRGIGLLEVLGAIGLLAGLLVSGLGTAAAFCLAVLMVGAVGTHLRAKDPISMAAPAGVLAVLSAVTGVLHLLGG